jgi:hypothetical protein
VARSEAARFDAESNSSADSNGGAGMKQAVAIVALLVFRSRLFDRLASHFAETGRLVLSTEREPLGSVFKTAASQ